MLRNLRTAVRRSRERARHRQEYLAILRLDEHLIRDIGIARSAIHERLDDLDVPV